MELITPLHLTASQAADRERRLAWTAAFNAKRDADLAGDRRESQYQQAVMFELDLSADKWDVLE